MFNMTVNGHTNWLVNQIRDCMVVITEDTTYAKRWKTRKSAEAWGNKYMGAGYGLKSFTVIEVVNN